MAALCLWLRVSRALRAPLSETLGKDDVAVPNRMVGDLGLTRVAVLLIEARRLEAVRSQQHDGTALGLRMILCRHQQRTAQATRAQRFAHPQVRNVTATGPGVARDARDDGAS